MGEMRKGFAESFLLQGRADVRRLAVHQECLGVARHAGQFVNVFVGEPLLAARHPVAVAGVGDGGAKKDIERQLAAVRLCGFQRQHPAANHARHRERSQRSTRRDRLVVLAIMLRACVTPRRPRRHDGVHAGPTARGSARSRRRRDGSCADRPRRSCPPWPAWLRSHCRLRRESRGRLQRRRNGARRRRRGDGRRCAGRSCSGRRRALQQDSVKPRLRKRASALGNRPRKAL